MAGWLVDRMWDRANSGAACEDRFSRIFHTHTLTYTHTYTHTLNTRRQARAELQSSCFRTKVGNENIQRREKRIEFSAFSLKFDYDEFSEEKLTFFFFCLENEEEENGSQRAPSSRSYQLRLLTFCSDTTHTHPHPLSLPFSPMGTRENIPFPSPCRLATPAPSFYRFLKAFVTNNVEELSIRPILREFN